MITIKHLFLVTLIMLLLGAFGNLLYATNGIKYTITIECKSKKQCDKIAEQAETKNLNYEIKEYNYE